MKKNRKKGFTLVELLAVIVILAIILVIAVPKVMSVIEDSKKATLESTAKMIASSAEKQKVQNTVLGNSDAITCDSVAKINKLDYDICDIEFDDNTAKVTIEGKGKFNGLWVCEGTKTSAEAQGESCTPQAQNIEVNHPLFLKGQTLTPDKFEVKATYSDGSTVKLWPGGMKVDETLEATTISSPNWPNNYSDSMTEEENYWEATYEGAEEIQITFDATSETEEVDYDWIAIYDEDGNQVYKLGGTNFAGRTYTITGDYVKVTMETDSSTNAKGFSATIKPANNVSAEYTISPSTVPNTEGNFDITITVNGQNMSKKITTGTVHKTTDYVASHKGFDTVQTIAEYNGTTYDAGIRYVGALADVNNQVYYNCEATDSNSVAYGEDNYDYASSCEVWRIIGVFEVEDENGDKARRLKIINTNSTFKASWDSSASETNVGRGVNQWGPSTLTDGSAYQGADLMQLLNGYYIEKNDSTIAAANKKECKYNNTKGQSGFGQTCDTTDAPLSSVNMKPLTSTALSMIDEAVWYTYATDRSTAATAYLQERGITKKYTGCTNIGATTTTQCTIKDNVTRDNEWIGLVGLMSVSDITYANGWLYKGSISPWSITPMSYSSDSSSVWYSHSSNADYGNAYHSYGVWPAAYLSSNVQIIGGDGTEGNAYKLSLIPDNN